MRARTLAMFGSVRIREFVGGRDDTRSRLDRVTGMVGLHSIRSGGLEIDTESGRIRLGPNEAFLFGYDGVLRAAPLPELRLLSIVVPSEVLTGVGAPAAGEVRSVSSASALLDPALAFAERAPELDPEPVSGFGSYYFERLLQEMVIGVAVEGAKVPQRAPRAGVYLSALAMIAAQREDPGLSPHMIADQLAISMRQLQRAFRSHDTTPERQIRRARVEHAVTLLADRVYDPLSIAEIGRYAGFADGSSLARAMAQEGHRSPAALRRASRSDAGAAAG
ncbi:helix-turn-helix domain-containing protein [Microbacterium oxydans]|uniref:helix-turn-helix domain-containing protein n=1 Tax=Microbacterium oxydans TaxID=82380 RepID=UPI001E4D36C6|nr:helix-turn-helix domain-containing protein [Microbacterium oxydans]